MNAFPIPLAPSVIKSLAKRLRAQPAASSLSVSASHEVMAKTLGYPSWHAANSRAPVATAPALADQAALTDDLLKDPARRRRLYEDLETLLEANVDLVSSSKCLELAAGIVGDPGRAALARSLEEHLVAGGSFGSFFDRIWPFAPLEALAIQAGERHRGIGQGLREARGLL